MGWNLVETEPHNSNIEFLFGYPRIGSLLYKSGFDTWEWDGAITTDIGSSWEDITQWGGDIYIAYGLDGATRSVVSRYNEVPNDWTIVDNPGTGVNPNVNYGVRPTYDGSQLIHVCGRLTAPSTMLIRSSSDGIVWNTDTVADCTRTQHPHMASTPFGSFVYARRTSNSHDYFFERTGVGTWAVSGTDITAAGLSGAKHYGNRHPALFTARISDSKIMYSQDSSVTWNATSLTNSGGTRIFGWAVGAGSYLFASTGTNLYQWNEVTNDFDLLDNNPPGTIGSYVRGCCLWGGKLYAAAADDIYEHNTFEFEVTAKDFDILTAWSPKAMSVSPDDYYTYVGVLDGSSNPVLLQLLSDLSADPVKAYDPGAGSAIGVQCADLNEEWVWIAGDFGGTIKVRVSIDDGATWITKDPGSWNGIALPLVVGPDDDNLVLVPTDGDDNLFETDDGGLTWATLNAALPFDVNGMDRLDLNLDEIIIGSDADRGIRYSPNNGVTLHDLSDVAMANVRVSDLIIG